MTRGKPPEQTLALAKLDRNAIAGVSRSELLPDVVMVHFGRPLTDDDLRIVHEVTRGAYAPPLAQYQLEVGLSTDFREVIVNHPELIPSPDGRGGHFTFTPQQARDFAALLVRKADECRP